MSCNGTIAYDRDDTFYSCPTGDNGGWNIYLKPVKGQDKCMPVWLKVDACFSGCAPTATPCTPSSTPMHPHKHPHKHTSTSTIYTTPMHPHKHPHKHTSTSTIYTTTTSTTTTTKCTVPPVVPKTFTSMSCSTITPPTCAPTPPMPSPPAPMTPPPAPMSTCPANLIGTNFEFPHLIVHVDEKLQDKALGNSLNGLAAGSKSSIFNFDIPAADAGKTCSLKFLLPAEGTMETSNYKLSGNGSFEFAILQEPATKDTTYETMPKVHDYLNDFELVPGNAYTVSSYPCPPGGSVGIWMYATGDAKLEYFQDFNPCPVGLYVTVE
ncbi:hypothetical protein LTR35_013250 [Friedmanniomyces endolithicus]|uniref:Ubiquitin 3 binding protein But2 C-terminal domain-containing protein n=1 Tax=Friedmanniomyces endolithicus TaxID=329885 RepID=A0AAN6J425_9PEZI|nr:hypothetical protein LTR35_013250 [Friedmanniomyces endolithicus]KAK0289314.1 hypothetical protein LTS00_009233 [Friedmanniomyces endolithicus]KAK0315247.1 hypothetical protein LTR82_012574 [Friedmanniomyces endolithicus]KAK0988193.1 hypothetical protein LTR54_012901 [Friedmanniomyces endolithicus]